MGQDNIIQVPCVGKLKGMIRFLETKNYRKPFEKANIYTYIFALLENENDVFFLAHSMYEISNFLLFQIEIQTKIRISFIGSTKSVHPSFFLRKKHNSFI